MALVKATWPTPSQELCWPHAHGSVWQWARWRVPPGGLAPLPPECRHGLGRHGRICATAIRHSCYACKMPLNTKCHGVAHSHAPLPTQAGPALGATQHCGQTHHDSVCRTPAVVRTLLGGHAVGCSDAATANRRVWFGQHDAPTHAARGLCGRALRATNPQSPPPCTKCVCWLD